MNTSPTLHRARTWFVAKPRWFRLMTLFVSVGLVIFLGRTLLAKKSTTPQYQTAIAERGTLTTFVSASGSVTNGTNLTISTQASGLVEQVFVKNGDHVVKGQKLATITLDQDGLARQASANANYLSAKNQLASAQNKINSLQAAEFKANQTFMNDAVARNLASSDPTYIQEYASWLQAENDYKNQSTAITQAQIALTSAYYSLQQTATVITAPATGEIKNLSIAPGVALSAQTNSSSTVSLQKIGTIMIAGGHIQASVNLSEVDATKVMPGQKVTLTLDAFADKTFTGSVLIVDTNGSVSSGVTTYPAIITFDMASDNIYPNMGVNAKIMTQVKTDVIILPSAAAQTANGISTVKIIKNGQVNTETVELGLANDTQIEIVSGVSEGDEVITGTTNTSSAARTTTSPFGSVGGVRTFSSFGGGGPR